MRVHFPDAELESKLAAFANAVGGDFPKSIKGFRKKFAVFDPGVHLSGRDSKHQGKRDRLADAHKTLLRHEHCFKLLSVPSALKNLCFLSEEDFTELQMSAHPSQSLLSRADIYP